MSITIKQSTVLTGNATIEIRPESATNETSIMECNTLGNARIESFGREHIRHQSGVENTVRECHNQKNCQIVSQSKEHQASATIKSISRTCHNQKFYQGVPQLCVHDLKSCLNRICHFPEMLHKIYKVEPVGPIIKIPRRNTY